MSLTCPWLFFIEHTSYTGHLTNIFSDVPIYEMKCKLSKMKEEANAPKVWEFDGFIVLHIGRTYNSTEHKN
jgi:hypothetical protein